MKLKKLTAFLLISGVLLSLNAKDEKTMTIKLEPANVSQASIFPLQQKGNSEGQIDFASPSGKLLYKIENNKLFFDINDDGKIDKSDGEGIKKGKSVSIPIKSHELEFDYVISLVFLSNNIPYVSLDTVLQGELGGKRLSIIDANMNGKFNDLMADTVLVGNNQNPAPLSPTISLDGKIYHLSFPGDKPELTIKTYNGDIGKIKLKSGKPDWEGTAMLSKTDGSFSAQINSKTETELIPGIYYVIQAQYLKDSENKQNISMLYGRSKIPVTVKKGENELKIGHPFKLTFKASKSKDDIKNLKVEEATLIDAGNFVYNANLYGTKKATLKTFIKSGDKKKEMSKLEYG